MHTIAVAVSGPKGRTATKVATIMAEDKTAPEGTDIQQPTPETPAVPETPDATAEPEVPGAPDASVAEDEQEDILTDPLEMAVCPGCKAEIDTSEVPPFTEIACPACGATIETQAKFGAFRLLRKLGSGGMGSVFLGQDDALNRKTAIKVVKRSLGSNPNTMEAFQREAQATAKLNHPNIVQIYAFGEEKGQPYIAMEFVGGGSLDGLIGKKVRMDAAFVLRVGKEIAQGLGAALDAGLIHGDVKPENILFDENYRAKLVDFGIASALSADVNAKEIWGTPYYIAPEKARGKKADIRSDLYSLGATLYHALTLHPPFDGPDARAVVAARFTTPPQPIGRYRPDVDRKAAEIVERMMHPNPMMRFPNVNALVSAIDEFLKTVTPASRADRPAAGLPTGSHPRITGVRMQAVSATGAAPAETEAETAPGGKKKIIISKSRRSVRLPAADPAPDAAMPEGVEGDFPLEPPMDIPPPKPKGNPVKGCIIAFLVLLGIVVIGAGAGIVWFVQRNAKVKAENERRIAAAKLIEKEADETNARIAAAAAPILKADAEAEKILKEIVSVVSKATEFDWPLPNLEPTEPILIDPGKPAGAAAAAPAGKADAPEAAEPAAAPADLKAIKDDPAFANGKNAAARKALIAFAMDKANAEIVKDPAVVEKVLAVVRDPENAKDADVMEVAVQTALDEAKAAAAAKAEAPADAPAADAPAPPAGLDAALDAMAGAASGEGAPAELAAVGEAIGNAMAEAVGNMAGAMGEAIGNAMAGAMAAGPMGVNPAALPFAQKAAEFIEPARKIRRARREAEMRRDRELPMFTPIKGDTMTDAQYRERMQFKATRERDEKALRDLLPECQNALKELRRNRQQLERESRPLLDAIREREAKAEQERQKAEAEAKAQREADSRKAKIQQEIDEAQSHVNDVEEFIRGFDYDRAITVLTPCKGTYSAEEANEVIQAALDRLGYLSGLRRFLLDDLHAGGGLSWGLISRDIVDADPEKSTVTARGGTSVELAKLDLRIWMNLIDKLVVSRDPKREHLSQSQHGDLLYGAAIFCVTHGSGNEAATKRAIEYARKARGLRETVTRAIPRLTPELKDALEDQF